MHRLALLTAAILACGCRPWCATPPEVWTASAYGSEAEAVAATDVFISEQVRRGLNRPSVELDAVARALGARDAAELAAIKDEKCLADGDVALFARARVLSEGTARSYLAERFGIRACSAR